MAPSPTLNVLVGLIVCSHVLSAQPRPMIEEPLPDPPPVQDPGPNSALVRVHIVDADRAETASATVSVNRGAFEPEHDPYGKYGLRRSANRHKGPIRYRPLDYYFFTDGRFEVRVRPGLVTIDVMKGYEYRPERVYLIVAQRDTVDVQIALQKAVDMEARGWYSGDTHIHADRTGANDDTLLTLTSAKHIRYAYVLSMNTHGYDQGGRYESWLQQKGMGPVSDYNRGPYYIASGQEYRAGRLGHLTIIGHDAYVEAGGASDDVNAAPSLGLIADQAHDHGGFIGLAHGGYVHQEADGLLLDDKLDFLELLQFGGYRSLGLDGWYDFLNVGFRVPIVGASDFPYTRELGSEITYVWSERVPTLRSFAEGVAAGRSFATSGPMVFLVVDGRKPGEVIELAAGSDTPVSVRLEVESPVHAVRYVELVVDGRVIERVELAPARHRVVLEREVRIRGSSWIAARTYAEAGTDAHTNPVYLQVGDEIPFDRDSARRIMARLDGSIEAIPNPAITERLSALKAELQKLLDGTPSDTPLPRGPGPE